VAKQEIGLLNLFQLMQEDLNDDRELTPFQRFAIDRQKTRMRKRARLDTPGLDEKAVRDFLATNLFVGETCVDLDPFIEHNAALFITEVFERYNRRSDPDLIQVPFDPRHLNLWRFGPGSANGVVGTHTAEKIWQPMSTTSLAKPAVVMLRRNNTYFRAFDGNKKVDGVTVVAGSRLATVPKNEDTRRTIAMEPSGNMALQLAYGEYVTQVLRSIGLDISKQQPKNKALARRGSSEDSLVTIDMKSASDMISPKLVKRLFPFEHFKAMITFRSPCTELPNGDLVDLNMISTMGNGFTFPVMTLIFLSLIYAVRLKMGGPSKWVDWSNTGVFGDDIIVPKHEAELLIKTLEGCGFIVNYDKSYLEGPFRESCGGDYFNGDDVTPFYVKSLSQASEVYVALNQVFEWCAKVNYLLPRTIEYLAGLIDGPVLFVPEWCGNDSGFRTTQVSRRYKLLMPVIPRHRTKCPMFDMMLAVGGFVSQRGSNLFFMPRPYKTRYKVRATRLPNGYLDGSDPLSRTAAVSNYVESFAFLLTLCKGSGA